MTASPGTSTPTSTSPQTGSEKHPDRVEDLSIVDLNVTDQKKRSAKGVVLVPQPSNSPADPLNWPTWKKMFILAIISLSAFIGLAQSLAVQAGFFIQADLYHKTPVEISYAISAAAAGLATGPLLWTPLSQRLGRSSLFLWTMVFACACSVWAASMTSPGQYIPFVLSRWLGGTFGACPGTLGAGIVIDIFYLHQRGKAFAVYTLSQLFGALAGPTIGGLILYRNPWPVQIWWTVGVEAGMIVAILLFLEETGFDRHGHGQNNENNQAPSKPKPAGLRLRLRSYLSNRIATFFPGHKILPVKSHRRGGETNHPLSSFLIMISPVTLLSGAFLCLTFGWAVAVNTLLAVFLQSPVREGGYAFTPTQNALFTFNSWVAIVFAAVYDAAFNDRVPLWTCKRFGGGVWKPEYRLYPLLVPQLVLLPVGLGLFGAALQYHLHFMVLAFADFLIIFCEHVLAPVIINYVVENFTRHAAEATAVLNFYRLVLGLCVPFFIDGWEGAVGGPGWVFGMMAFLTLGGFAATGVLAWKGPEIRKVGFTRWLRVGESEEGVDLDLDKDKEADAERRGRGRGSES